MTNIKEFNSLLELMEAFPTEESCIKYLEGLIWPNGVISPFDRESKVYVFSKNRYICKNTGKIFNVRIGTIFENMKLSLKKWFIAIWLIRTITITSDYGSVTVIRMSSTLRTFKTVRTPIQNEADSVLPTHIPNTSSKPS